MSGKICQRCGAQVRASRCLKCGSETFVDQQKVHASHQNLKSEAPSPRTADETPQRPKAEEQKSDIARPKPRAQESQRIDPATLSLAERHAYYQNLVRRYDQQREQQLQALDRQLAEAKQDVSFAIQEIDKDVQRHQTKLTGEQQHKLNKVAQGVTKVRQEADQALEQSAQRYRREITSVVTQFKDTEVALSAQRIAEPSLAFTAAELTQTADVKPHVTVGRFQYPNTRKLQRDLPGLPVVLPLMDRGHIFLRSASSPEGHPDPQLASLIRSLVTQAYVAVPPGQLVVTVFNPRSNRIFAPFSASIPQEARIFKNIAPSRREFEQELEEHLKLMENARQSIGTYSSMGALVQETGQHQHQYRLFVILDAPKDWSRDGYESVEKLLQAGGQAGVSMIIQEDSSAEATHEKLEVSRLEKYASVIVQEGKQWSVRPKTSARGKSSAIRFTPQGLAAETDEEHLIQHMMSLVTAGAEKGSLPNIEFEQIVRELERETTQTSDNGVRITMGKTGTQTTEFVLGDTSSNIQNVLVGGRAGSGKTNLLKVMIYSMAARYDRSELEMFLLDFKEGGDFMPFIGGQDAQGNATPPLPNASVVTENCDADFGLATLEHFMAEMKRRSDITSGNGVSNIWDLRKETGIVLPRWLLVIDEFQGLFTDATYQRATLLLEELVRKGRSFGLHVILATQTLSGVKFAGDKDRAIYENISGRVVLQLGAGEFKKFMDSDNDEGDQLRYRGQAIFNPHNGLKSENQHFVVAYASDDYTQKLQHQLAAASATSHQPFVYRGGQMVSAQELLAKQGPPEADRQNLPVWLGRESTISADVAQAFLSPLAGSHVLLSGGSQDSVGSAIATLQTAVLSAVAASKEPIQVLVLEELLDQYRDDASIDQWYQTLAALGGVVRYYGQDTVEEFLADLEAASQQKRKTIVAMLGTENTDLKELMDEDMTWKKTFRGLPRQNVHVIGYWDDLATVPGSQFELKNDFKTMVFFGTDSQIIVDATRTTKHDLPELHDSRALIYSAAASQQGTMSVAAIRPLSAADLDAFQRVSTSPTGDVQAGGGQTISAEALTGTEAFESETGREENRGRKPSKTPRVSRWKARQASRDATPLPETTLQDIAVEVPSSTADGIVCVLGKTASGVAQFVIGAEPHQSNVVLAGDPGTNSMGLLTSMIHSMASHHSAEHLLIDLVDNLEDSDLVELSQDPIPQLRSSVSGGSTEQLAALLETYLAEISRREQASETSGVQVTPRWLLIVTEYIATATERVLRLLNDVAAQGPRWGLHVVVTIMPEDNSVPEAQRLPAFASSTARVVTKLATTAERYTGGTAAATLRAGKQAMLVTADGQGGEVFSIADLPSTLYKHHRTMLRERENR